MDLKTRTINNALWSAAGFVLPLILFLVTTPYYAEKLGAVQFGILFLVLAVIGGLSVLDFGFSLSVLKYVSEYIARGDAQKIKRIINSSFTIHLTLGIFGSIVIFLGVNRLVDDIFNVEKEYVEAAKFAFHIASLTFTFKILSTMFASVINAFQRYDITTKIGLIFSVANLGGWVILLYLDFGLRAIVVWYCLLTILQAPVYVFICRRLLPGFKIRLVLEKDIYRMLLNFSMPAFVVSVLGMLLLYFNRVLIGAIAGVAAVTFYTIPSEMALRIHNFLAIMLQVIFPLSSELAAKEDSSRLKYLYFKGTKVVSMLATSVIVPMYAFSDKIIVIWMGEDFASKTGLVFPALLVSYYILTSTIIPYFFLNSLGRPGAGAIIFLFGFALNISACLFFIPRYGINGAAIAALAGMIPIPLYTWTFHKISGFSISRLLSAVFFKIWLTGILQFIVIKFLLYDMVQGRISLLLALFVGFMVFYLLFVLLRFYDDDDKNIVLSYIPQRLSLNMGWGRK